MIEHEGRFFEKVLNHGYNGLTSVATKAKEKTLFRKVKNEFVPAKSRSLLNLPFGKVLKEYQQDIFYFEIPKKHHGFEGPREVHVEFYKDGIKDDRPVTVVLNKDNLITLTPGLGCIYTYLAATFQEAFNGVVVKDIRFTKREYQQEYKFWQIVEVDYEHKKKEN